MGQFNIRFHIQLFRKPMPVSTDGFGLRQRESDISESCGLYNHQKYLHFTLRQFTERVSALRPLILASVSFFDTSLEIKGLPQLRNGSLRTTRPQGSLFCDITQRAGIVQLLRKGGIGATVTTMI